MPDEIQEPQTGSMIDRIANSVAEVKAYDPEIGAYNFSNLGELVRFSDLMSRADVMLPAHLRGKPALCLAVTMRAQQWKMDPFALAMETYQAKEGAPIAYQAKVFVAALRQCAGIRLQFRYEGELVITDKPVTSNRGNEIAKRTASGSLKCIAYASVGGEVLEYETPTLDEITIKNSPGWHNTPRDQLAYFAGRGWTRRYEPGVMMGAYSVDEVETMQPIRDVTPKQNPMAAIAAKARAEAQTATVTDVTDAEPAGSHWTDGIAWDEGSPGSDAWDAGAAAFAAGQPITSCPHEGNEQAAADWLAAWHGAQRAAE